MADRIEHVYDRMAPFYQWVFGFSLEGPRKRAIQHLDIKTGEKILEVGVGTGFTFRRLPEGVDFTGIDLSEKMLDVSKALAKKMGRDYKLLQMDASHLEFPDESFDIVIAAHFLSATSNPTPALVEMKRVLKKEGRILLVNNFQRSENMSFFEPLAKKIGMSLRLNLIELCLQTGLRVQSKKRVSPLMPIDAVILTR